MKEKNSSISQLLVQVCKLRRNRSNALLVQAGIHSGQDILLYYLSLEDGQTVSELAEKMCIQPATISNMIDRMAATGMVVKGKDGVDKRITRISITQKGKTAYKQVAGIWNTMEEKLVQGLTKEDQSRLQGLLKKILHNLE